MSTNIESLEKTELVAYSLICNVLKNWFMLSVRIVTDARGKFGEHERSVRVARGAAESNSSFLSALQTSQVHP